MSQSIDIQSIHASSALTPTGGFLRSGGAGFTHSFSPAIGCLLGKTACGDYCYAQFLQSHMAYGRGGWGEYLLVKENAPAVLRADLERASRRDPSDKHHVSKIRVFSASSTEPLAGPLLPLYKECLRVVADFPIAAWALQTRSPRVVDLEKEITALQGRISVSLTIETDDDHAFSFGRAGSPRVDVRRRAAEVMSSWPVPIHVAVSPMLPLTNANAFAEWLGRTADLFTVDTAVDGDGTGSGKRTARTPFSEAMARQGIDWRDTSPAQAFYRQLAERFGARAGWSAEGFRRLADPATLPRRSRK